MGIAEHGAEVERGEGENAINSKAQPPTLNSGPCPTLPLLKPKHPSTLLQSDRKRRSQWKLKDSRGANNEGR